MMVENEKARLDALMADMPFYTDFSTMKEIYNMPVVTPNRITGEGRMKCRGGDKVKDNIHKKRKKARKMVKQSKRRNRK